jgi:type IV pilus assembly protein PilV
MGMKGRDKGRTDRIRPGREREAGFTLVEVIMAISILTVGILAVASMQYSAIRGNAFSQNLTESTDRVQDRIEKIMSRPYGTFTDQTGDGNAGLTDNTTGTADYNDTTDPEYTILWNVATNWPMTNLTTIQVIALWSDHGVQKQANFQFMKVRL